MKKIGVLMMSKKQEPLKVIIRNADGTICEDISKKEWSPERRQMIAEAMGDAILEQQGLLDKLRN
ncbi:hypothetical protein NE250_10185 [Enterococcus faecalis]|uniref:hypothetical protein n=2 Tax=Enterococcus faecalis TaxID=1351 RepID=UPI0001B2E295|nr:hypothetical protein [Enterococcus faecalis]EEU77090.1 predicted protein [Enterococcus faecalis E1Sol]EFU06244.1 hypothetical protein HMPREF9513_01332 [Enterococcus faecalis TX0645]EGO8249098.1 hypothetical protein [Enterococcus faecalis]EHD7926729.1 hypothetical protein [Enterococcus faecalis]EKN1552484.1 hypothetical protein [Enterococcus faecalis]